MMQPTLTLVVVLAASMGLGLGFAAGLAVALVAMDRRVRMTALQTPYPPTPSRLVPAPPEAEERMRAYAMEAAIERGTQDLMERAKAMGRPITLTEAREGAAAAVAQLYAE